MAAPGDHSNRVAEGKQRREPVDGLLHRDGRPILGATSDQRCGACSEQVMRGLNNSRQSSDAISVWP